MNFSIIVPTYNRSANLDRCLASFMALDKAEHEIEVLVVDDGSVHPPIATVDKYNGTVPVRLLQVPHGGPAKARNAGAKAASGEYLIFVDDDCAATPSLVTEFAKQITSGDRALGGRTVNALQSNIFAEASQELIAYLYQFYSRVPSGQRFFTTSNLALPADVFESLGGFDETFPFAGAEDRDLCERIFGEGYALQYVPSAVVEHRHRLSFTRFVRQHFTYGRGARILHEARVRRGQKAFKIERYGFYPGFVAFPFTRGHGIRAMPIAGLFCLSQVVYIAGYFTQWLFRQDLDPTTISSGLQPPSMVATRYQK